MSENNQNNRTSPEKGKREQGNTNAGHRNHHHRPHRGHRPRPENAEREQNAVTAPQDASATVKTPQEAKPHQNGANRNGRNKPHANTQQENRQNRDGKGNGGNRERDGKGSARGMRGFRQPPEKRLYDPYEKPSKEEISLSELRAQIVLKAADGSVPTVYGATPSTEPKPTVEAKPTESQTEGTVPAEETAETPTASDTSVETPTESAPAEEKPTKERVEVVGVRFRASGKMYYFDPQGIRTKKGDYAIVETTRGPEFGEVCLGNSTVNLNETVSPLRPLLRIATPADVAHNEENRAKEKEALIICQEKIRAHGLEMKLIDVQYAFDNSKLLFYFAAEGRVDFRELVKDLASVFRTRIELRQIGIRDEAKMLGGIGACGRALCCSTFLPDFAQVSIKMAKEQNLSLNSTKISGVCGRLMCCLRYEADVYAEEIKKTPHHDATVRTPDGVGTVISSNPLAGTIRVILKDAPDTPPKQFHRDEVTVLPKEKKGGAESKDCEKAVKSEKKESEG